MKKKGVRSDERIDQPAGLPGDSGSYRDSGYMQISMVILLRKLGSLLFLPPVMLGIISLAPFAIFWSDYLSSKSESISRSVGFDPTAFGYACICIGAFSMAFFLVSSRSRLRKKRDVVLCGPKRTRRLILLLVGGLAIGGFAVTILTVTAGGSGYINAMASRLLSGEEATDLLYGPQGYIRSASVSGLFRMFGGWTNAAIIIWLAIYALPWRDLIKKMYWPGLATLLVMNTARAVLGGDRGPALVAFLLTAYVIMTTNTKRSIKKRDKSRSFGILTKTIGIAIIVVLGMGVYATLDKLRKSESYNTIILYGDMGVGNLSLEMKTGQGMGYGYYTFGGPISIIFRYLGIEVAWPQFTYDYVESGPYLNMLGYIYADFRYFGFIIYGMMGFFSGWIYFNYCVNPSRLLWRVTHLYILWALSSSFTVPIFTGMQYWVGLLGALVVSRILDARRTIRPAPDVMPLPA